MGLFKSDDDRMSYSIEAKMNSFSREVQVN